MKKFFCFVFVFLFTLSLAYADSPADLSKYSDTELIRLYSDVKSEFERRDLVYRIKLQEGMYTVGFDFPEGLYYVSPASYVATFSTYKADRAAFLQTIEYSLFPHSDSFLFEFYTGTIITVKSGSITLRSCIDGYGRTWLDMSPDVVRKYVTGK